MTEKENRIQEFLQNWKYTLQDISRLEDEIRELAINITPSYGLNSGGGGVGIKTSKVESYCERKVKKERELAEKRRRVEEIDRILSQGILSKHEKNTINCLMEGGSLKRYAKMNGLYKSYVYKIKDNAIKKIAKRVENNTF